MATRMFLKYPKILGDATVRGHAGEIEIYSFQWGVGRGVTLTPGSAKSREVTAPEFSELVLSKLLDMASIPLAMAAAGGKPNDAVLSLVEVNSDGVWELYRITLGGAVVSSYSQSGGGDRPSESISLNFAKITLESTLTDPPQKSSWDLTINKGG